MRLLRLAALSASLLLGALPAAAQDDGPVPASQQFGFVLGPSGTKPHVHGFYAKGCLEGAQMLPTEGPYWQAVRLSRNRNWGHPKLVAFLETFAKDMRDQDNWPGLLISDMSQPRGGPMLTGHKSHQIGLDADIWYKPMPDRVMTPEEREDLEPLVLAEERGTSVIAANWNPGFVKLIHRAASYAEVERIFVHPAVKKALCEATPAAERSWLGKVRPLFLHNYHFHVRLGCPPGEGSCESQKATTGEDGCGKELDDWLKLVSRPPPPEPEAKPGMKPQKPHTLTLSDLPKSCKTVLAADAPNVVAAASPSLPAIPPPERKPSTTLAQQ